MLHTTLTTNNHGTVLITALMFVVLLSALGATTVMITTHYSNISGNNKASVQALHVAEAGAEEARNRLRRGKTIPIDLQGIQDAAPTSTAWLVYIGTAANATSEGYTSGIDHSRVESFPTPLIYTVRIRHARDGAGYTGNIRKTPSGDNIYEVTSYGSIAGARSIVQTYIAPVPSLPLLGTVYVEAPTQITGNTTIDGRDQCGSDAKPGVITPQPLLDAQNKNTIKITNSATIYGDPASNPDYSGTYSIVHDTTKNINVHTLVETYGSGADITISGDQTNANWGTPAGNTCSNPNEFHIVKATVGVKLNNIHGCGALVIDGNLDISGTFAWYGPIIVAGTITFTGGGTEGVQIMGAVLSGDSVLAQVPSSDTDAIKGTVTIKNCSDAVKKARNALSWSTLSWGTL